MSRLFNLNQLKGQNPYLIILCIFCLGFPFYSWFGTWCLILFVIVWVFDLFRGKINFDTKQWQWPMQLYFMMHLIGMIYTEHQIEGWQDLQSKIGFLLIPVLFLGLHFKKDEIAKIVDYFVIGVVATNIIYMGFAGYNYFFLSAEIDVFFYSNLTTPFKNHPAYTASYSIFALVYFLLKIDKRNFKFSNSIILFWLGVLMTWLMVIFYSGRMQILAMMCILPGILLLLWWRNKKKFQLLLFAILFPLATIFTSNSFPYIASRVDAGMENIDGESTGNIRFKLWESAGELISHFPLLGVGTGDLESKLVEIYKVKNIEIAQTARLNVHNQYIQSFSTLGILGLLTFLLLLFVPAFYALKTGNILVLSFYLIFILGTLTECMMESQRGSVWLAVFGCLFWQREEFFSNEKST